MLDRSHFWTSIIVAVFIGLGTLVLCDEYMDKVIRSGHQRTCQDACNRRVGTAEGLYEISIDSRTLTCRCWDGYDIKIEWITDVRESYKRCKK